MINAIDSDKRLGSITACEDMAFSGCFMGRRTLGIESLNAELFRVSGTINSELDYEGFAFAAAAAVVTALSPDTVPQEALVPLDWRVTAQVVLAG